MKRAFSSRKLAEWITLLVSATVIVGLIAYLVMDLVEPASHYVELTTRPVFAEVEKAGERYVLPIDIENRGQRAVARANIRIAIEGDPPDDVEIQYVGKGSTMRIYKYFERDPRNLKLSVSPTYYVFE